MWLVLLATLVPVVAIVVVSAGQVALYEALLGALVAEVPEIQIGPTKRVLILQEFGLSAKGPLQTRLVGILLP